jgi:D-alanyl-D-alanine carboxypeptidase/Mannosyl-glycoprotein endo-beta-N-acetylglucosaminidase
MARIPVSEIPNAPGVGPAPPTAPYGQVPGPRFANQPTSFTPMQGRQQLVDFNKYAAGLQQQELPGGFAEGAAMISAAAGRYAQTAGDATASGAASISNALNSIGSIMTDAANKANASKDAVDLIRYQDLETNSKLAFEAQMTKEQVPVEQWAERWQTEGAARFMGVAQNLGTTPATRARIQARATGYAESQSLGYTLEASKKQLKDSADYLTASYKESEDKGDANGMRTAATESYAQKFENEGQYKLKMAAADKVEHQATIDFAKQRNPLELQKQATLARNGKAEKDWDFLNTDPALANKTLIEAATEVNRRQAETLTDFANKIGSRDVKLTDKEIETQARAAGLDEEDIRKLKKFNETEVVWDNGKVAKANQLVASYDVLDDVDPKTGAPTMTKYKETLDFINANVPKENRQLLINELNKAYRDGTSGKVKDARAKEQQHVLERLQLYRDQGLLYDPKLGKPLPSGIEGTGEKKKVNTEKTAAADKEQMRIQSQLLDWAKAHTDFEPGEMVDKLNELTSPHKEVSAKDGASYREQQAKETEVRRAQLVQDKAFYKNIGGVPQSKMPQEPRPATPPREEWEKKTATPGTAPIAVPPPTTGAQQFKTSAVSTAPGPANVVRVSNVLEGRLAGKEDVFQAAANKHGVDAALLMAIAQHETGRGTSAAVNDKNNPGGMMDAATDWAEIKKFASLDEGIDAMAANLKEKYIDQGLTTIEQIQKKYAPVGATNDPRGLNKDWVSGVSKFYEEAKGGAQQVAGPRPDVKLDSRSTANIATLLPTMQTMATDFLSRAKAWAQSKGLDVVVTEGLRSLERQKELYAQGRTKPGPIVTKAKPGQSNHGTGRAMDVAIIKNGKVVDDKSLWAELGKIGKASGLRWGGEFKSIYDPEHFELPG